MTKILVIDPERGVRNTLKEMLEYEGYRVDTVQEYAEGIMMAETIPFDAVVCDWICRSSFRPVAGSKGLNPDIPLIVLARNATVEVAVSALRDGAFDFLNKPVDMNRLLATVKEATDTERKAERVEKAEPQAKPHRRSGRVEEIVGTSRPIQHVKHLIDKVAPSEARVLITGANGTGKELVARWLHEKSIRATGPFVEVNCAAIPSELIESELFGHEKGAFTSAIKTRKGKFEQADGGTLFMDEIGDMSLAAQAKVLRVLQERKLSRVGSDRDLEVNVRVVAATNKDLLDEVSKGNFREDLYHRLSVIVIHVPPLAQRIEDVPLLVDHFIGKICSEYGVPRKKVDKEAVAELKRMGWRGNIRELRNVVERLIILSGNDITLDDVRTYASGIA